MAETELYYYAGCSSCRNAEHLLADLGVPVMKREYFKQRFTREELAALLERIGRRPAEVLSTRSRPYKELDLASQELSDGELLDLMVAHPQLLRRPLTVRGNEAVVGFNRSAIQALAEGK